MTHVARTYDAFAPVYDRFTASSDYEAFACSLEGLLAPAPRPARLLDLACGTGKSFLPFLRRGFSVTGCDLSEGMLGVAAAKAPLARLFRADLRDLDRIGRFGLVTCLNDVLNYMADEDDLARAFASMARNLDPGGYAVFDLNTLLTYRTTFARDEAATVGGVTFHWRGRSSAHCPPGSAAEVTIEADIAGAGEDLAQPIVMRHRQRHFQPQTVERLLIKSGLRFVVSRGLAEDGTLSAAADEASQLKIVYVVQSTRREVSPSEDPQGREASGSGAVDDQVLLAAP